MAMDHVTNDKGVLILKLGLRFDFACHLEFRQFVAEVAPGSAVTVDFADTKCIDSAALGLLLLLGDKVGRNKLVRLINTHGQPREALELANFHQIFDVPGMP